MGADYTPTMGGYTGQGAFRFWCQKVLPLVYDESLSYYELLCKVVNYLNNVITDVASCETNIQNLYNSFVSLQDYVNDYFENLDVTEAVKNNVDADFSEYADSEEFKALVDGYVVTEANEYLTTNLGDIVAEQIDAVVAEQLPAVVTEQMPDIIAPSVTNWLDENVGAVGETTVIDKSLTIEDAAAESQSTGKNIKIASLINGVNYSTDYVLRNDGTHDSKNINLTLGNPVSSGTSTSTKWCASSLFGDGDINYIIVTSKDTDYSIKILAYGQSTDTAVDTTMYINYELQQTQISDGVIIVPIQYGISFRIGIYHNDDVIDITDVIAKLSIKSVKIYPSNLWETLYSSFFKGGLNFIGKDLKWRGGGYIASGYQATSRYVCCTYPIPCSAGSTLKYTGTFTDLNEWIMYVFFNENGNVISRELEKRFDLVTAPAGTVSVAFSVGHVSTSGIKMTYPMTVISNFKMTAQSGEIVAKYISVMPESEGAINVRKRANQHCSLNLLTVGNMPTQVNTTQFPGVFPTGTNVKGVTYSSVRKLSDYVPNCVNWDAYITSFKNPYSYIYTKENTDRNSKTYYGSVCSNFVAYCYGIDTVIPTTFSWGLIEGMERVVPNNIYEAKIGDCLNKDNQHIVIITGIYKDALGYITSVDVVEEATPWTKKSNKSLSAIINNYFNEGFVLYRYNKISEVPPDNNEWFNNEGNRIDIEYEDKVLSLRGNKSNWIIGDAEVGTAAVELYYNNTGDVNYESIQIYNKSNVLIQTIAITSNAEDTVTATLPRGKYKAKLHGETDSGYTYFDVFESAETYTVNNDTVSCTFNGYGNDAVSVAFCEADSNDSDYNAVRWFHILTDTEKSAQTCIVPKYIEESGGVIKTTYKMRAFYQTEYGLAGSNFVTINY